MIGLLQLMQSHIHPWSLAQIQEALIYQNGANNFYEASFLVKVGINNFSREYKIFYAEIDK